ncbi:hypothetical protein SLEP1_g16893 [Rubroshorea leprosula]|uniref:Ribosomal protein L32 n=1 Tax=Rubroshorea leprosula TaxID=152421 RepID=A0AAV5IYA3_9ROSI|nr:hypothetical protein SLEP1_g16893 [Rubroshorea leprosula]
MHWISSLMDFDFEMTTPSKDTLKQTLTTSIKKKNIKKNRFPRKRFVEGRKFLPTHKHVFL